MTDKEDSNADYGAAPGLNSELRQQDMAACMDKFANTFEASARRWELVVYPSLLAFIVLAAYGFFLIYTLTNDVGRLARSMETVVVAMGEVATDMNNVSRNVTRISDNLGAIAVDVNDESETMRNMVVHMGNINKTMGVMTVPIYHMRDDMSNMNHTMRDTARPMRMFPF
ncbi:MAG TPA: DUF948 domain-containing protein [Gammaproteobacteria bacterium]|nr:DUF948 domain-containing protein [Gammaproteobacteria bacterium]